MSHAREAIRNALVVTVTDLTTTDKKVFKDWVYAQQSSDLPSLSVYVAQEPETIIESNEIGAYHFRSLPIRIVGRAKATSGVSDVLDDIAEEVETAIAGSPSLANFTHGVDLVSTEMSFDGEGEVPVGVITMDFVAVYRVNRAAPTEPVL